MSKKELEGILMLKVNGEVVFLNSEEIQRFLETNANEGEEFEENKCCNI